MPSDKKPGIDCNTCSCCVNQDLTGKEVQLSQIEEISPFYREMIVGKRNEFVPSGIEPGTYKMRGSIDDAKKQLSHESVLVDSLGGMPIYYLAGLEMVAYLTEIGGRPYVTLKKMLLGFKRNEIFNLINNNPSCTQELRGKLHRAFNLDLEITEAN